MPVIAVTGATGFIGAAITRKLLDEGWRVRALARSVAGAGKLETLGVDVVRGALADADALARLTANADAVVHCAGAVRGASYPAFAAVNVDGTANLLRAIPDKTIPLLLLSSLAAREPGLSHYARSKRAMEDLLAGAHAPAHWLALRPPAVYGPGDRELMPLFQALARGFAPLPAPPDARVSLLYVDDLAGAVLAWLRQPKKGNGVFEIHDGRVRGYAWDDVVATAQELLGRRIRKLPLPATPLRAWARANAGLARVLGYAPMLTPGKLRELRHADWVCDNAPLQQVIDWQPRVALAQGLQRTCGWSSAG